VPGQSLDLSESTPPISPFMSLAHPHRRPPALGWSPTIERLARIGVIANLLVISAVTMRPGEVDPAQAPCGFLALSCGELVTLDVILNAMLFAPLGACLVIAGGRPRLTTLGGFALSAAIEALQLLLPGRYPALRDILANGAGGLLGATLAAAAPSLLRGGALTAHRLLLGWTLGLGLLSSAGAALLHPSAPDAIWFGQWAPELGNFERYAGAVISAELQGAPLPSRSFPTPPAFRASYSSMHVEATATAPHGRSERAAPIVSVFDEHQRKILILGQHGDDLIFEPRLRGEDWGLRGIAIRVRGGVPANGDTLWLGARYRAGVLSAASRQNGEPRRVAASERLSPISAWRMLLPWRWPMTAPVGITLDGLMLGLLALPIGVAARRAQNVGRRRVILQAVVVIGVSAIVLVPLPFGLEIAAWPLWLGLGAGMHAGIVASRLLRP